METEYSRSDWYGSAAPRASAPAAPVWITAPALPEPPVRKRKKKVRVWLIILLSVLGTLLLVAASVLLISVFSPEKVIEAPPAAAEKGTEAPTEDGQSGGTFRFPFDSYGDYGDYFGSYSQNRSSGSGASNLPRAETGTGVKMTLESSAGKRELTLKELYQSCVDSVVGVYATVEGKSGYYWGTGIIMTADGYILTNQHIIAGTDTAGILLPDGTECPARLVGEDDDSDIAVLKIEAAGLHAAVFGDSTELSVGDPVAAIGNPLMTNLSDTLTNGIVSGIERSVDTNGQTMTLIQTNTALNEGNSGGPLFNMYGQVVGITNMKINAGSGEVTVEGIGFAIPTATVRTVANRLIAAGEFIRPGIGITVRQLSDAELADLGTESGLSVEAVSAGCDAEKKGVQVGDIITHVDGTPVRTTAEVLAIRDTHDIGEDIVLTVLRDGKTLEIAVTLVVYDTLY